MTRIDPDDPKWTAYVLDELDPDERAAVELELHTSEEARGVVEELRVAAAMMKTELRFALAVEPLTEQQRKTIISKAQPIRESRSYKPQWLWLTGFSTAAALIAVFVVVGHLQPVRVASETVVPSPNVAKSNSTPAQAASASMDVQHSATTDVPSKRAPQHKTAEPALRSTQLAEGIRDVLPENKDIGTADGGVQKREDIALQIAQAAKAVTVTNFAAGNSPRGQVENPLTDAAAKETILQAAPPPPAPAAPMAPLPRALTALGGSSAGNQLAMTTSSYPSVRGFINQNMLPPRNTVRIEDMVNYFTYDYPQPAGNAVLSADIESAAAPWNDQHRLVRIGIQGINARIQNRLANVLARNVAVAVQFDSTTVQDYHFVGSEPAPRPIVSLAPGQRATLLYEVVPAGKSAGPLTVTINYEEPVSNATRSLVLRYSDSGHTFAASSTDFRFAAAVASFGLILSDSPYKGSASIDSVRHIVADSIGTDANGMRREFLQLVQRAAQLQQ